MKQKYFNRQECVHRMEPGCPSIAVLSEETGVPRATLYAWLAADKRLRLVSPVSGVPLAMTKRSKARSPSVKFALLSESHGLQGEALQTFCHQKGVTLEELLSWRDLALAGIESSQQEATGPTHQEMSEENDHLKEELRRNNEALAEAAALLILQKKTSELLGGKK